MPHTRPGNKAMKWLVIETTTFVDDYVYGADTRDEALAAHRASIRREDFVEPPVRGSDVEVTCEPLEQTTR